MRKILCIAVSIVALICITILAGNIFPDATYSCFSWAREWTEVLTTLNNYQAQRSTPAALHFALPVPFAIHKLKRLPRPYDDRTGYQVLNAWLRVKFPRGAIVAAQPLEVGPPFWDCFPPGLKLHIDEELSDLAIKQAQPSFFKFNKDGIRKGTSRRNSVSFSLVGISRDLQEAFFMAQYSCGHDCGEATYSLMRKVGNHWTLLSEIPACSLILAVVERGEPVP